MKRYLTTPIYYASGSPHLGHAYTTLVADCYKRFYRSRGDEVMLTTGTDEHGQKNERAAARAGLSVERFVEGISREFAGLWEALGLAVDRFERTTLPTHERMVQEFWRRLSAAGEIYLGEYEGLYCIDCEQYFTEGETCPVHGRPLERFAEPSYFFRLGRYRRALIDHIKAHPEFILPEVRRREALSFLEGNELRDLSISRASTKWGVPVPGDGDHVMYVWVDALLAYVTAICQGEERAFDDARIAGWWADTTHFIGKDILTFHAVYWPAMLLAAGLPLPARLVVNGWLTVEGRKIAKSDPVTIVDPAELAHGVGRDGLRWYFLRTVSLGQDCNYSREHLVEVVNADLANNIGNLYSRVCQMLAKGYPEGATRANEFARDDVRLLERAVACRDSVEAGFAAANPAQGARSVVELSAEINTYVQQQKPWSLPDPKRRETVLWVLWHALHDLSCLAEPFLPETIAKARKCLALSVEAHWGDIGVRRERVFARRSGAIFPRIRG